MGYTIAKVSKITGLSAYTLRYYEKEGLLPNIKRDSNGNRDFSENDLGILKTITCLKNSGMSIKNLKRFIDLYDKGEDTLVERLEIVKEHKLVVEEKMKELNGYMEYVNYKIKYFEEAIDGSSYENAANEAGC